jgi:hypothetical protein
MRLPTKPLLLPTPFGNFSDREFNKILTDSNADAARTTKGAQKNSIAPFVADTVRTPLTTLVDLSVVKEVTTFVGKRRSLFVQRAALSIGDKGAGSYSAT